MFGLLLFSVVVLSAVNVGSPLKISATVELNTSSTPQTACHTADPKVNCRPNIHAILVVTNNNRVLDAKVQDGNFMAGQSQMVTVRFPDVLQTDIQLPLLLSLTTTVEIKCPGGPSCNILSSFGAAVDLIKLPNFSNTSGQTEAQLTFYDDKFNLSGTLIVKYDTSGITNKTECEDHSSDDFCPKKLPYSCPIFSDSMKNPCCPVNVDSSKFEEVQFPVELRCQLNLITCCIWKTESICTNGTASESSASASYEDVYMGLMINFLLISVILAIILTVLSVCYKRLQNRYDEDTVEVEVPTFN